jgi:hypothetical protein
MTYGTLKKAMEYADQNRVEEWLQLFLRNDGKNIEFADGLLLERRYYLGPVKTDITKFNMEEGAPSYLTRENDIEWFFTVVDKMKSAYDSWDMPPLIVNYINGIYEVNDGRHRYEALRQMGVKEAYTVFWMSSEEDYLKLRETEL